MATQSTSPAPGAFTLPPIHRGSISAGTGGASNGSGGTLRSRTPNAAAAATAGPPPPASSASPAPADMPSLTDVHAQRILAVLNEAIGKLETLFSLPPVVDRRAVNMLGKEVATEIDNYNTFKRTLDATRLDLFKQLLVSTKLLTLEKLTRSAHDEECKKLELAKVVEREKKARAEVENVKLLLDKAKRERVAEISAKNEVIRKLKDELKDIKQSAEDVARKLEQRTKAKEEGEHTQFSERELVLQTEIKALQAQLATQLAAHKEEELALRKRKFKVESEVDAWIQKYDQDMDEKQSELDDITAIYTEEKAQLDDLQQRYEELERESKRLQDERQRMEAIRAMQEAERQRKAKCATLIQATWRGFRIRKMLKEQKEKKKKGGKSGKKKKK
ncbi:hypothetical protein AMAG_01478 [Allomyces macrogynus ATCC 38327]|uniref:Dynein regulatory complex protein 10 n=1 Tax=Allomyces macrogynus (strain ATCC 38327) TaxID=578462 RepID=A0A0L0RYX0_ALLM3|nr:hypothetical protein AMAG_01478 [Allomyces macrogynus ATCC 38327]|eukprot:KNE55587.1 hypothetical protein AMAG_01478 [Allomyces macrogynus ATCC 38327]